MTNSSNRKGIILAGGTGSRLYPITQVINKQLLPVYDKPMIYYPLSTLMLAGIDDVLLISSSEHIGHFREVLGNGAWLGISIRYAVQPRSEGIAQAFLLDRDFIDNHDVALILGDNFFFGHDFSESLAKANSQPSGATVFSYEVQDPQRFGVVEFNEQGSVVALEEKPPRPKSHHAVTGLYFYDNRVVEIAANLQPSSRGELEITDVNLQYLKLGQLHCQRLERSATWFDMGTTDALFEAAEFVRVIEKREGLKVGCVEEVAYRMGFLDSKDLNRLAARCDNAYCSYLYRILEP